MLTGTIKVIQYIWLEVFVVLFSARRRYFAKPLKAQGCCSVMQLVNLQLSLYAKEIHTGIVLTRPPRGIKTPIFDNLESPINIISS